jgi:hypothetical protein
MEGRLTVNATDSLQPSRTDNVRPAKATELLPVNLVRPITHKMNLEISVCLHSSHRYTKFEYLIYSPGCIHLLEISDKRKFIDLKSKPCQVRLSQRSRDGPKYVEFVM